MTPCLVTFEYDLKLFRHCNMPSHKEVECEILKINKEISNLKWQIKNEVLTDRKREVKRNKIRVKSHSKRPNEASRRVEGLVSLLPETIGNRYVWNTEQVSHCPRWKKGEVLPTNCLTSSHLYAFVCR